MTISRSALVRSSLVLLLAALLEACGGGGVVPSNGVTIRALPAEYTSRHAVAYSPFRSANRDTETITSAMIKQDLDLLVAGNFKLLRLFDSSDAVSRQTLQVIKDNGMDIKVQLGVWVASGNETATQADIARGVVLANTFRDIVLAVSVGNECMVSWSFNPVSTAKMAGYLGQVRSSITQPVTTDDNYAFFASAPTEILKAIDFVALHTYSILDTVHDPGSWDWQQASVAASARATAMMDAALAKAIKDHDAARTYLDRIGFTFLPIVIGETGWKATVTGGEIYRAHPVNQKMYFDRLATWKASAGAPKNIFYFEAFDEPWKGGDDGWGLFNVSRKARYVVQGLYPSSTWEPGTYTAANALYYIPTAVNAAVTANRYTIYAEATTAGEAFPSETLIWNAWQNGTTAAAAEVSTAASEGTKSTQITPIPLSWGWGMTRSFQLASEDLSNFQATGTLNFSVKTTYSGKIEVGFLTGTAANASLYDVYIAIGPGEYGYVNDGAWHPVSIPISAITPHGAMAFGMTDPSKAKLDLKIVTNPFVLADRYGVTGKATSANITTPIFIDNIYWAK